MSLPLAASSHQQRAYILIGTVLVLRLLYVALFAVNLAGDEAYYWDWGRQLDYGYYSKPPFIAWLYALVDWIGGGSLFAIRATATLLGTGSLWILYRFSEELFDSRTAWFALLLAITTPANVVLSFFLTIDAPLIFCWSIALWMFWRTVNGNTKPTTWLLLFLALAIGHLCKQMMMLFPILALIYLAFSIETRPQLKQPRLWIVLIGSYLSLIPPLLWNARHDWITFQHTSHHFEVQATEHSWFLERLGEFAAFLGTQLGVLSPGTAFVVFSLCLVGLPLLKKANQNHRYLLIFGALPLAVMLLLALRQKLQPNWAAVYYLSGIVLAGAWYSGAIVSRYPPSTWRRLFPLTLATGLLLCSYFYFAPPLFSALGQPGHKADPNRRLNGYDQFAREFEVIRRSLPESNSLFLITLGHRDLTSQLAFGLPDQPRVYRWEAKDQISSQYELWNNPIEDGLEGHSALILTPEKTLSPRFAKAFTSVVEVNRFKVSLAGRPEREFVVYLGRELKEWPKGR